MKNRVLVAMSGGVDSTYVAIKLKEQGYEVIGTTFKINNSDSSVRSVIDAKLICDMLNISHVQLDFESLFKEKVIDYFVLEYSKGLTPNPCVICNKEIKFKALNELRKSLNCQYIATGHYAKIVNLDNKYYIKRATNIKKDQSYFLNQISKDILPYLMFPLSTIDSKDEVREYLRQKNIVIAEKKESQEICFVDNTNLKCFLNEYIKPKVGNILNSNGDILGKHSGAHCFTIGQRKGLGISTTSPVYVLKTNIDKNIVYVGTKELLYSDHVIIDNINILAKEFLTTTLYGKIRFRTNMAKIQKIEFHQNTADIYFDEKQKSITPGQFLVIYHDDILVLGGKIT
ncbi:MAG: tRNA 2-thiouridine(34) synthase MnmA [Clostridia bacterium]